MQKISDGFIQLIVRWIILSKMLDVRKDADRTDSIHFLGNNYRGSPCNSNKGVNRISFHH